MKKKRIAAAGLAVIMALTAAGCHQTSKEDTAQTTVKENRDEKDTSKEQIEKEETEKKVLHPYIHTDSVSGYVNSADGSVQINYSLKTGELVLSDEEATAYPELNQALTLEYDTLKKSTQEDLNNLKESAEEMVEYMQGDDNMHRMSFVQMKMWSATNSFMMIITVEHMGIILMLVLPLILKQEKSWIFMM